MYLVEMKDGEEMRIDADEMTQQFGFLVFENGGDEVVGIRADEVRLWREIEEPKTVRAAKIERIRRKK